MQDNDSSIEVGDVEAINDDSIFQMPDLILKIGPRKLFVTKNDFKQISEVFEAMLTNDFKEKNLGEIEFKGKDYNTFVRFLRVSHPGLKDPFEDEWVHDILPLIDEYLAEDARCEADKYFVKTTKRKKLESSSTLIDNLLKAEKYQLSRYLKACISLALKRPIGDFLSNGNLNEVSLDTRYKICIERLKESDKITNNTRLRTSTFD